MTGIRLVLEDDADDDQRRVFERIEAANGSVLKLYRVLAHSPVLLEAWIDFAWSLRFAPRLARGLRELAILRVAAMTGATYERDAHVPMAVAAGISEAKLSALATWTTSPDFDVEERLVLRATEELTGTAALTDATRDQIVTTFGEEQTVELVVTIAFYSCVSRVLQGLGVPLETDDVKG